MSIGETPETNPPGSGDPWPERARVEGKAVRTIFRVRYAETDRMGVAYYGNYLTWFEVLRGDYMRAVGLPYTRLEAQGYFLPIAEAHVRYLAPARYDEAVEVVGTISDLRSRSITFNYHVEREGKTLATGWTRHVPVGDEGRPRQFPRELLEALEGYIVPEQGLSSGEA